MSKRTQERRTEEGPAVAKPRPTCFVSRNQLSAKQTSSLDSDASNVPEIQSWIQNSVSGSTGALVRDRVRNPATSSQEWQHDNPCLRSTRTLVQRGACERAGSIWKLVQGVADQLARTRLDFHRMQICDYQYVEKVFENLPQKLNHSRDAQVLNEKTNALIWGLFLSATMKASVHLGPSCNANLVAYGNTNFKELRALFDITQRLILEQAFEILNVSTMIYTFSLWMTCTFVSRPSNQVGESKSIRLLRFSFKSGKDV